MAVDPSEFSIPDGLAFELGEVVQLWQRASAEPQGPSLEQRVRGAASGAFSALIAAMSQVGGDVGARTRLEQQSGEIFNAIIPPMSEASLHMIEAAMAGIHTAVAEASANTQSQGAGRTPQEIQRDIQRIDARLDDELEQLRRAGLISEEEYQKLREERAAAYAHPVGSREYRDANRAYNDHLRDVGERVRDAAPPGSPAAAQGDRIVRDADRRRSLGEEQNAAAMSMDLDSDTPSPGVSGDSAQLDQNDIAPPPADLPQGAPVVTTGVRGPGG